MKTVDHARYVAALTAAVFLVAASGAQAAMVITSPEVDEAARAAKAACEKASQVAAVQKVDLAVVLNFKRIEALCLAAANAPVATMDFPERVEGAEPLFDAVSYTKAVMALSACGGLANQRALDGRASLTTEDIAKLTKPTTPHGKAVFDPRAIAAFAEIQKTCLNAGIGSDTVGN